MSITSYTTAIETLFFADFATAEPAVYVAVDNDNYKPGTSAWVRFSIRPADSDQFALGNVNARTIGIVFVQIFTPQGFGSAEERRIADSVAGVFRGVTDSGIVYGTPNYIPLNKSDGWKQANVLTEFRVDEFF